jgi:GTP-sensing pleiotropic transcriptional regulator CodY
MADRDRDEKGRYREQYPSEVFIEALEAEGGQASTSAVADRVGCTQSNAYQKLSSMADGGLIEKRQFGRTVAWTVSPEAPA